MKWGFAMGDGRSVINARSETVMQKPMFWRAVLERRCAIPASGYYEWQKVGGGKKKYYFHLPEPLFLAGCWREEKDSAVPAFVILTREAVGPLAEIHDRMPVMFTREYLSAWLLSGMAAVEQAVTVLEFEAV